MDFTRLGYFLPFLLIPGTNFDRVDRLTSAPDASDDAALTRQPRGATGLAGTGSPADLIRAVVSRSDGRGRVHLRRPRCSPEDDDEGSDGGPRWHSDGAMVATMAYF